MRARSLVAVVGGLAIVSTAFVSSDFHGMWMGEVNGKDGMTIKGNATMKGSDDEKSTIVEVELKGDAAGSVRPWHIHTGTCAAGGGVFGGGRSYTPITMDGMGGGKSTATLPVALPDTGKYYVNIHDSGSNMGKIVACGDLMHHDDN